MQLSALSAQRARSIVVLFFGLTASPLAFGQSTPPAPTVADSGPHRASSEAGALYLPARLDGATRLSALKADRSDASIELDWATVRPAPRNPIVIRRVARPDGTQDILEPNGRTGGPPYEKLIYSSTRGSSIWVPGIIGLPAADDWATISVDGCPMTGYSVTVNGGGDGQDSFLAVMVLYDGCPGAGGAQIPGTLAIFQDLTDDESVMHKLTMILDPPLDIPPTVWARVSFSTATAGWVFGAAPEVGFSADSYWHPGVSQSCGAYFGGAPPHASFWGEVLARDGACSSSNNQCSIDNDCPQWETCEGGCPTQFLAYSAAVAEGERYRPPSVGQPTRVGDDFTLTVTDCELSSYELGVRAFGGPFTIDIDLRPNGFPGPYGGTQRTLTGIGDGRLEIMRATFPEGGIFIDQYAMMTWKPSRSSGVGAVNAGRTLTVGPVEDYYPPDIEAAGQFFWLLNAPGLPGWFRFDSLAGGPAIFYIVISCKGTPPRGACCPNQEAGAGVVCYDGVTADRCEGGRWARARTCAEQPFDLPCGTHACCTPDDDCENLLFEECDSTCEIIGGSMRCGTWEPGRFCSRDGQFCPIHVCTFATGDCLSETPCAFFDCECISDEECQVGFGLGPTSRCIAIAGGFRVCAPRQGCDNIRCCDTVCRADFFCCETVWDSACASLASDLSDSACRIQPGNDECASDWLPNTGWDAETGATAIQLFGGVGEVVADLRGATVGLNDPPMCCNNLGLDEGARNTRWYTFTMPAGETSARINTCLTGSSFYASNSLLQVFEIADASAGICSDGSACTYGGPPGQCPSGGCLEDEETVCQELVALACDDDAEGCGFTNQNSRLCIDDLVPGATYYVLIGASTVSDTGIYTLRIEVPCPTIDRLPPNDACEAPTIALEGTTPFDLDNATFQCPGEECALALKNDVWFRYTSDCVGLLRAETCDANPSDSDPATTLAIYQATTGNPPMANCPPSTDPIACNDDAEVGEVHLQYRPQACGVSGLSCVTDVDCSGFCSETDAECGTDADCNQCANFKHCTRTDVQCVDDSWCDEDDPDDVCEGTDAPCLTNADCRWCSKSHQPCRDNFKHCSLSGNICTTANDCAMVGETCDEECQLRVCSLSATLCGQDGDCPQGETCNDEVCIASNSCINSGQTCVREFCESSCGAGSALLAPIFLGQQVLIRVGGEYGGEPSGDLTLECVPADCDGNDVPELGGNRSRCQNRLQPKPPARRLRHRLRLVVRLQLERATG